MGKTSIEWTDASWNPIVGCTEISPGCAHCYAARLAGTRLLQHPDYVGLTDKFTTGGSRKGWNGAIRFLPMRLGEPLTWKKPRRIFVCDMGDLFHESVDIAWIDEVFRVIERTPHHTYQILTKRAKNMRAYMVTRAPGASLLLKNVWLGVSVENQHFASDRICTLLETPAAVRWISAEPLLAPLEIMRYLERDHPGAFPGQNGRVLDWVVCGGESGPNARPMHPEWARSLCYQCQRAGVPFFFKQWGEWEPVPVVDSSAPPPAGAISGKGYDLIKVGKKFAGRLLDGRVWNEFPPMKKWKAGVWA